MIPSGQSLILATSIYLCQSLAQPFVPTPLNTLLGKRSEDLMIGPSFIKAPVSYDFVSSACDRAPNATTWLAKLQTTEQISAVLNIPVSQTQTGSCPGGQICLDGIAFPQRAPHIPTVAYCVDPDRTFRISGGRRRRDLTEKGVPIAYGTPPSAVGPMRVVEVVFAGTRGMGDKVSMKWIKVFAQQHDCNPLGCDWRPLADNACYECASLGLQPVPEGTSRILVQGLVPAEEVPYEKGVDMYFNVL